MSYSLLRPALFALDAETAHHFTLRSLKAVHAMGFVRSGANTPAHCAREVMGIRFPNPVGLAAGLDKNGDYIDALGALGFGFIEIGTVTPRPQPGNPKPRLFRLPRASAIINRMGFNNLGVDHLVQNVRRASWRGVLGINIGKNFSTPIEQAADDYVACLSKVYGLASYVTVNISSPNTKGLRDLQAAAQLEALLGALAAEREKLAEQHGKRVPLALKIAPDLEMQEIVEIAGTVERFGFDAVIATNTTVGREAVADLPHGAEAGGLSGEPVRAKSTAVVHELARTLGGRVPVIGVGGIASGTHAKEKIAAGASLVQLYTGLVYRGPALVAECVRELCA